MRTDFESTVANLVDANRILFNEEVVDGFGHVSVRHPDRADRFLISRSLAPALVTADDIVDLDLDGESANSEGPRLYLERFIHAAIYKRRPDVHAVVHSHSATLVQFGIVRGLRLQPVCHMCGFLGAGAPVFEIREAFGDGTDLLIRDAERGSELANSLGDHAAILMRGHGSTVVGGSLQEAVFRSVYLEKNAKIQSEAMKMGDIVPLTLAEAEAADAANFAQIGRAWDLWKRAADNR